MLTVHDALVEFVTHYNAAVGAQPKDGEPPSPEYTAETRAALKIAVLILQSVGLLPTGGCGECDACKANATNAVDSLLAALFGNNGGQSGR